jgi:hypothetical protein
LEKGGDGFRLNKKSLKEAVSIGRRNWGVGDPRRNRLKGRARLYRQLSFVRELKSMWHFLVLVQDAQPILTTKICPS